MSIYTAIDANCVYCELRVLAVGGGGRGYSGAGGGSASGSAIFRDEKQSPNSISRPTGC